LLYLKGLEIPEYYKLFLEQTNGLLIETNYFKNEFNDPTMINLLGCNDLFTTKKKVNGLPDLRFVKFAGNEEDTDFLFDTKNFTPTGLPLILFNQPVDSFCIPLTADFNAFLTLSFLGFLNYLSNYFSEEPTITKELPNRIKKKKQLLLPCLKDCFTTVKREIKLLSLWHLPSKSLQMVKRSCHSWLILLQKIVNEIT
jgi:hypothetical protein